MVGAIDIIIVEHPDGRILSSPWYVRFPKGRKRKVKNINVFVNDIEQLFTMKLDSTGLGIMEPSQLSEHNDTESEVGDNLFSESTQKISNPEEIDRKIFIPSYHDLLALRTHLHIGKNDVVFTVHRTLGDQSASSNIWLLNSQAKLIISDIDGTITKSDGGGHVLTKIGLDWIHPGIVSLYNQLVEHDFTVIYLSARPIDIINSTRKFLQEINQNDIKLPQGPVIVCPDGFFHSLKREVIDKEPDVFKIPTLETLAKLFTFDGTPFVIGFGNTETDVKSYSRVGVQRSRIFLFDKNSQVLDTYNHLIYHSITEFSLKVEEHLQRLKLLG